MLWRFGPFELDAGRCELRRAGLVIPVEPQVLALLVLLVTHRDRLVSRDELVDRIWNGRIVSESAIASRIKSARHALGDSGEAQIWIKTAHGLGFRFIGDAEEVAPRLPAAATVTDAAPVAAAPAESWRPSIAVLPFRLIGDPGPFGVVADALPHDLISDLSRLRWLFVIARGSSFRFRDADQDVGAVGQALGVRYCLCGTIEIAGPRIIVSLELSDARDQGIIWSDRYASPLEAVHEIRERIAKNVVAALEVQIPLHEAHGARLRAPERLDAWSNYHLGLQHMYRFTQADNQAAIALFRRAVAQEPDFARAHGGLSFSHFQNAFLRYPGDVEAERSAARRHAEQALTIDSFDPFANLTMGRSLWLVGDVADSVAWFDRAIALNPNYAQGVYSRAWAETMLCNGDAGVRDCNDAMALSPIDPLRYAMLSAGGMAHLVRGELDKAAEWSDRGARTPGAHVLIEVIAGACNALAGNSERAHYWAQRTRQAGATVTSDDFFQAFPFKDDAMRTRIAEGLETMGI
jgi:TolB-like protein